MSLFEKIDQDMRQALKAGEKEKLTVLRGLKSALKYAQIDKGEDLSEQDEIAALSSQAKKVRESIEMFAAGGRDDLVAKEKFGLAIIESYLPQQLDEEKLRAIATETIAEVGAQSPKDIGLVMKAIMPKIKGQADGKLVNKLVGQILASVAGNNSSN